MGDVLDSLVVQRPSPHRVVMDPEHNLPTESPRPIVLDWGTLFELFGWSLPFALLVISLVVLSLMSS